MITSFLESCPAMINIQIHATDHFVCRTSHGVPADRFCRIDGAPDDHRFRALGDETLSHLCRRFRSYFSHPALLGEMAGPALREVCAVMHDAVANAEADEDTTVPTDKKKKPFRIYSCHDVTILSLLYALGGGTDPAGTVSDPPPFGWPAYGTCLTLELVRENGEAGGFFVRAHSSEPPVPPAVVAPVHPVAIGSAATTTTTGEEPPEAIDLAGFEALVEALNAARTTTA